MGFEVIDMATFGRYCQLCVSTPTFKPEGGALMRTDSVRLGAVGTREGIRQIQIVLGGLSRRPRDFHHLIAHQTSLATITSAMRAANEAFGAEEMHEGNVVVNLAERGNTASTTHFVALWDFIHAGRIHSGDRILFTTIASGLVVGVGAYTLDDLPSRLLADVAPKAAPAWAEAAATASWTTPGNALPPMRFEAIGIADEECPGGDVCAEPECGRGGVQVLHAQAEGLFASGVHRPAPDGLDDRTCHRRLHRR